MNARERLEMAIKTSGLSQAECARRAGMKPQHLNAYLKGKYEVNRSLPDLAKALNVPVEWLTTGAGDPPWWDDPVRTKVVDVPYHPAPPPRQGPKTEEEAAQDDRAIDAVRRKLDKIDETMSKLLERMDSRPCMLPAEKVTPDKWNVGKPKVVKHGP